MLNYKRTLKRERKLRLLALFGNSCTRCGFTGHPEALDFAHRDPKTKTVGIAQANTWARAVKEAEKCDILCANCHRIQTYQRGDTAARKKDRNK